MTYQVLARECRDDGCAWEEVRRGLDRLAAISESVMSGVTDERGARRQHAAPVLRVDEELPVLRINRENSSGHLDYIGKKRTTTDDVRIHVGDIEWIALPKVGDKVEVLGLLPESLRRLYESPILREGEGIRIKSKLDEGAAVPLLAAVYRAGLLTFVDETQIPRDRNGRRYENSFFKIPKNDSFFRLITDLRSSNRGMGVPTEPDLPNPDQLIKWLRWAESGGVAWIGQAVIYKRDVDNFYHRLKVPEWMIPYQGLAPVSAADAQKFSDLGVPVKPGQVPCLVTLAMGNSHSVTLSQGAMLEIVARATRRLAAVDKRELKIFVYIDDVTIFGTKSAARKMALALEAELMASNLKLKEEKSVNSSRCCEVMGVEVNLERGTVGVGGQKARVLYQKLLAQGKKESATGRELMELLGAFNWFALCRRPLLSYIDECYRWVHEVPDLDLQRALTKSVRKELQTAAHVLPMAFTDYRAARVGTATTDACMYGGGMVVTPVVPPLVSDPCCFDSAPPGASGESPPIRCPALRDQFLQQQIGWCTRGWTADITRRELAAAHAGVVRASKILAGRNTKQIVLFCDNMGALGVSLKGRSRSRVLNRDMKRNGAWQLLHGIYLERYYVPTAKNIADGVSRGRYGWMGKYV